ncbi:MAG: immunoglobulin domain-containing protein, partial [Verrucomicrobiota bacterium]
ELRNDASFPITANANYWGEPTTTELNQNQVNLSRIYDKIDNSSYGLVTIQNSRFSPMGQVIGTSPSITSQPQSQTVTAGGTASFTVAASGSTPFNFQWRKNGNSIGGATNASLVLFNVQAGNAGTYTVVVSNSVGNVSSAEAILTVNPASSPLATRAIIKNGSSFAISVAVSPVAGAGTGFIEEVLPAGFIATGISGGGSFNGSTGKILWGPFADNQSFQLTYTLQPPGGFQGNAFVSGTAYFSGATIAITGDSLVSMAVTGAPATLALTKVYGFRAVLINGEIGRTYRLEAKDNLNSGAWTPLADLNITQNPRIYLDADATEKSQRFYRAVLAQ